jgi:hypothetical protein
LAESRLVAGLATAHNLRFRAFRINHFGLGTPGVDGSADR